MWKLWKELPDNAQFCGNCGTKTGGVSVNTPSASDGDDGRSSFNKAMDKVEKKHPFLYGILMIAIIIFGIYYFVTGSIDIIGAVKDIFGRNTSSVSANNSQQNQSSTKTQQSQSNNSKPQSNSGNSQQTTPSNTETLTYYINGNAKTANVVFLGNMEKRFSLDAGGNVVLYDRLQRPGENWTDWASEGIIKRQDGSFDDVADIAFWLNEISFSNAIEETTDGMRLILIWQKIDDFLFGTTKNFVAVDFNNDCVYTMQKVYERK